MFMMKCVFVGWLTVCLPILRYDGEDDKLLKVF